MSWPGGQAGDSRDREKQNAQPGTSPDTLTLSDFNLVHVRASLAWWTNLLSGETGIRLQLGHPMLRPVARAVTVNRTGSRSGFKRLDASWSTGPWPHQCADGLTGARPSSTTARRKARARGDWKKVQRNPTNAPAIDDKSVIDPTTGATGSRTDQFAV